jgi:hypothetical protein
MIVGAPLGPKLGLKFAIILNDGYEPHCEYGNKSAGQADNGLRRRTNTHMPALILEKQKSTSCLMLPQEYLVNSFRGNVANNG